MTSSESYARGFVKGLEAAGQTPDQWRETLKTEIDRDPVLAEGVESIGYQKLIDAWRADRDIHKMYLRPTFDQWWAANGESLPG